MPGYFIGEIEVTDPEAYETYRAMARKVVLRHGGEYLAGGDAEMTIEGDPPSGRVVILKFPSLDEVTAWFHSDDYAEAYAIRTRAAHSRCFAAEGPDVAPLGPGETACYYVGEREVHDEAAYKDYSGKAGPVVEQYRGTYLVRGGRVEPLEGTPPLSRIIVTRWPSVKACLSWFHSPEYTPVYAIRKAAATCRTYVVEGLS